MMAVYTAQQWGKMKQAEVTGYVELCGFDVEKAIALMDKEHDTLHQLVSQALGKPKSPALENVKNSRIQWKSDLIGFEEELVFAVCKWLNLPAWNDEAWTGPLRLFVWHGHNMSMLKKNLLAELSALPGAPARPVQ